jgi:hypothetical protein
MYPETFNLCVIAVRILCRQQQQFSIVVWAGIVGYCLVGPHVLPHRLTGNHYSDILLRHLPELLEDVPLAAQHECGTCMMVLRHILAVLCEMFSVTPVMSHDGGIGTGGPTAWPPHSSRAVRDFLSNTCHDGGIGAGGPTAWISVSAPDLNPLDFYLWGHLNAAPVDNEEALHRRIVDACQTIRNYPGIFARMWRSMMRRVEGRIQSHGGHSEH